MVAKRWNSEIYNVKELLRVFDNVIENIVLPSNLNPKKYSIELILKVLVIKEFFKSSLRAMENLAVVYFGIKISKSVIYFWEKKLKPHISKIVNQLLKQLWNLNYNETFIDSTKFSNKGKSQIKIHVVTRYDSVNKVLFPISISLSKSDLIIPCGEGNFYGDGEYDNREVLNKVAKSGYNPIIKKTKKGARGYGAKKRDKIFDKNVYKKRSICEGFFGGITNRFGDRLNTFLESTTITRIFVRIIVYALTIMIRYEL
jgi:hypothetical protein